MIRTIRNDDIDGILGLLNKCKPYVIPHHKYQYWILTKYHSKSSFVYIEGKEILGFLGCIQSNECNSVFVWQICVDQSCRGKGIAIKLLNELYNSVSGMNISRIDLTITYDNEASINLFEKFAHSISSKLCLDESLEIFDKTEKVYRIDIE